MRRKGTRSMNAPQIIYLALNAIGLGVALAKHGQPRDENYNFFMSSIAAGIQIALLAWGGFFG